MITTCDTLLSAACSGFALLLVLVLLTITASCEIVRYRIKFTFFIVSSAIAASIFIPLMLPRIRDWRNALLPAWCVKKIAKIIGITYRIRGKENIVQNSGCIVLINHQSALDLCVLGELWSVLKNCTVVSKIEILFLGTFGLASWLWGTIFINRRKREESHDTINTTAKIIRDLKAKLLVFPEGHRRCGNTLQPFKKGAFHLAIASQTPIQPVVVSKYHFLNSKMHRFDSGVSYISILPPISTEGLTKDDLPALMERAYQIMNNTFLETSRESYNEHVESLKLE